MTDIAAIRDALAALALAATITVADAAVAVRAYAEMPLEVDPGQGVAVLLGPSAGYVTPSNMDGGDDVRISAIIITSRASERLAQNRLDAAMIALRDAFTSGATADWDFVEPGDPTGYGEYQFGTSREGTLSYYGFTMPLLIAT